VKAERVMTLLGLAGLLPFLAGGFGVFLLEDLLLALAQRSFLIYSLAILCFLAGTLWGETLPEPGDGQRATILVSNGIVLFAFFAILTAQPVLAAGLLLLGHLAQLWYERQSLHRPAWYVRLRTGLTTVAALCHLLFIAGLIARPGY
jgi:hypothetical protein